MESNIFVTLITNVGFPVAVNKVLNTTSFAMEVESRTDKSGAKTYSKESFFGIKTTAVP